jgi:hypothetical protein
VILVMAVLSAATEFNWGTMRVIQAVPAARSRCWPKPLSWACGPGLTERVIGFG